MFVITGTTGKVGGQVAKILLARGLPVRAVMRDAAKAKAWADKGCETALAAMHDEAALSKAFADAEAVFVLLPPTFDPSADFCESRANVHALVAALHKSAPKHVVALSTIGAQAEPVNLLSQLQYMEQQFTQLPMPMAFLRAAWFMENSTHDVEVARSTGVMNSFLQPLEKPVPMVATADVAATAAALLQENWQGQRVVELEGPEHVTPLQLAASLGRALGRDVRAQAVPRANWESLFHAQGMSNPGPRMRMLDGFNEGWIEFEGKPIQGTTPLDNVLAELAMPVKSTQP